MFCFSFQTQAQNMTQQQTQVVMRIIGHNTLLLQGDSTSRVLPVKYAGNNRYEIEFESAFTFTPVQLVLTIDSIVKAANLTESYIVEMQDYATDEIVYSYQVEGNANVDIIPCGTRLPPEVRYRMIFTILEKSILPTFAQTHFASIGFVVLILLCFGIYFRSKRKKDISINPDIITLGEYKFDKRNMHLSFGDTEITLSSKEADLLGLLHASANKTLERERILRVVWGDEGNYIGRTLDVFISKLRKKLEADPNIKIANIRGVGYKLILNDVG